MDRATLYAEGETAQQRLYANLREGDKWLDSPMIVSIETYAKCNAACTFCPYPDLERQGTRLDRGRVMALIDEVAGFARPPARLNLSRVNEPLLDPRIFEFLEYAAARLPKTQLVLFSNGQPVTDRTIDRLNAIPTFQHLSLSFNEHEAGTYAAVMGLDQAKTLTRLRHLHDRV